MKKHIIYTTILLLLVCSNIFSQGLNIVPPQGYNFSINVPSASETNNFLYSEVKSCKMKIRYAPVGDYVYGGSATFTARVVATFVGINSSNQLIAGTTEIVDLNLNKIKPEEVYYLDITSLINNDDLVKFNAIITVVTGTGAYNDIKNDLRYSVNFETEYATDVKENLSDLSPLGVSIIPLETSPSPLVSPISNSQITFYWDNTITNLKHFPNYQFQLLKLYNTDPARTTETSIDADVNWANALTILTESDKTELKLTIAEGTGYYIWRVRPIGNYYEGGVQNSKNFGEWTSNETSVVVDDIDYALTTYDNVFFFKDKDDNKNWIYSRSFSEGNKMSEQASFANGLQQSKQTQAYMPSNNNVLLSQNFQDYSGRDVLSTLPVPSETQQIREYRQQLVKKTGGTSFSVADFDADGNFINPATVEDGSSELFHYYSGDYTDDKGNVPSAEGYPYSRTLYYNDGTNRVKETAGPGKANSLGDQDNGQGRTTRVMYATPSEQELIQLFGEEAPNHQLVLKTITVDANNTTSVSYSLAGKVIATCLAKNVETYVGQVNALETTDATNSITTVNDFFSNNIPSDSLIVSTKRLAFPEPTTLNNIVYTINCPDYPEDRCTDPACTYDLTIRIKNVEGIMTTKVYTTTVSVPNPCTEPAVYDLTNFIDLSTSSAPATNDVSLPNAGTYIIEKELKPTVNLQNLSATASENAIGDMEKIINYIKAKYSIINSVDQYEDFINLMDDFATSISVPDLETFFGGIAPSGSITVTVGREPITEEPINVTIAGGCCDPFTLDLNIKLPFNCNPIEHPVNDFVNEYDIVANPNAAYDFEGYLRTRITVAGGTYDFETLFPEYRTEGDFNTMIFNMLNSESTACGNYTCNDLWSCWIATVENYENLLQLERSPNQYFVMEEDGLGDALFEQIFDEGDAGILADFIAGALGLFANNQHDSEPAAYTARLTNEFLNCTGYKFEEILTDNITGYACIDGAVVTADVSLYDDTYSSGASAQISPYTKDARWAFKYFTYNTLDRITSLEEQFCFDETVEAPTPCRPVDCPEGTGVCSWTCAKREQFYRALINFRGTAEVNTSAPELTELPSGGDPAQFIIDQELRCNENCENRRAQYTQMVINMFTVNCYDFNTCVINENSVTQSDIDAVVDRLILNCSNDCDNLSTVGVQTIECGEITLYLLELDACSKQRMLRSSSYVPELYVASKCTTPPPVPGWVTSPPETVCPAIDARITVIENTIVNTNNPSE